MRIHQNGGFFISRLKANANPLIIENAIVCRGQARELVGQRLEDVLPFLRRKVLDVWVQVDFKRRAYCGLARPDTQKLRLVGVLNEETGEYHLYLTNIPPKDLDAEQIAEVYRLR